MTTNILTAVMVHGAWADGSSWAKVFAGLRQLGLKAVMSPLPLTSLADDVAALNRTVERIDGPVMLVGHAYGGAVIGAASAEKVRALIYVAALAPAEGQTVADVFYLNQPQLTAPKLAPDSHGLIWFPSEAFAVAFAQNASAEEQALLNALQRPISPACITVPVGRPLWLDVPTWYLLAEQDHMISPQTQLFMAERMKARISLEPVDHIPSVTAPDIVVKLLTDVARQIQE